MNSSLVTISTFLTPTAAETARAALEAAGVRAFLVSSELVATAWHLGSAVGHVQLQVAEADAVAAREVLLLAASADVSATRCGDCGLVLDRPATHCPACGWNAPAGDPQRPSMVSVGRAPAVVGEPPHGPLGSIRNRFRWLIWLWLIAPAALMILVSGVLKPVSLLIHSTEASTDPLLRTAGWVLVALVGVWLVRRCTRG